MSPIRGARFHQNFDSKETIMEIFENKVAVVTGAASGIGQALAQKCLEEGMKVMLADIESEALAATQASFRERFNNPIETEVVDVSISTELEKLKDATLSKFDRVHLLFNNAGVGGTGNAWSGTEKDWAWVLGVNLMSVIHGQRLFVPHMLEHGEPGHIVNTASVAGLIGGVTNAPYSVTKHGVVALTEHLYRDLAGIGSNLSCSVLCPGIINTKIGSSARNRPANLTDAEPAPLTEQQQAMRAQFQAIMEQGMAPSEVAEVVFRGIRSQQLYLQTHEHFNSRILDRAQHMVDGTNPDFSPFNWAN